MVKDNIITADNYNDLLDRKRLAQNFVSVLISQDAQVFSINGGWGSGKTWFLEYIEQECSSHDNKIFIKYNVWENDYLETPLLSVISEITNAVEEYLKPQKAKDLKEEIQSIKKTSYEFIKRMKNFKFTPKLSYTLPDGSCISGELGIEKSDNFETYNEMKKLKNEFSDNLKNLFLSLNNIEIIVAIDELDRCRPDYAVSTLEVIKHFFAIKGLKFILAVDKKQLANTVKALYGQEANTDCYLRKFVDIEYNLPKPEEIHTNNFIHNFIETKYPDIKKILETRISNESLVCYNEIDDSLYTANFSFVQQYIDKIKKEIIDANNSANLSLRDIEKLFFKVNIILNLFSLSDNLNFKFLWNLLIMNIKYFELYKLIKDPITSRHEIFEYLKNRDDKYFKFILENKELYMIIQCLHNEVSHEYLMTRRGFNTDINYLNEANIIYGPSFRKYFEIIDMTIGFNKNS